MPTPIVAIKVPLTSEQKTKLRTTFDSEGFGILMSIISSQTAYFQTEAMNAMLYADLNEDAKAKMQTDRKEAELRNGALEVLDGLSETEDEWFTVQLQTSR